MDLPEQPFEMTEPQKQAFATIQSLLASHFDAAICVILVEHTDDARKEHIESHLSGSPTRGLALAHLAVHFAQAKFIPHRN